MRNPDPNFPRNAAEALRLIRDDLRFRPATSYERRARNYPIGTSVAAARTFHAVMTGERVTFVTGEHEVTYVFRAE